MTQINLLTDLVSCLLGNGCQRNSFKAGRTAMAGGQHGAAALLIGGGIAADSEQI